MKYKGTKKFLTFMLAAVLTFMLITADRESSQINSRTPLFELTVKRISQEYFRVDFLGYSGQVKAEPLEEIWKTIGDFFEGPKKQNEPWQETVLV